MWTVNQKRLKQPALSHSLHRDTTHGTLWRKREWDDLRLAGRVATTPTLAVSGP
jgi:hypothetical protein